MMSRSIIIRYGHRGQGVSGPLWSLGRTREITSFPWLKAPTEQDSQDIFQLMDCRTGSVITAHDDLGNDKMLKYSQDWTRQYKAKHSSFVIRPESTTEISKILKYCNDRRIGVVPQAGNTSLVGGSVGIESEIVLSVERMSQIHGLDSISGILKVEAGCILQDLQEYAAAHDHLVPVDLGAKGTCQIGGNVSTNAGGSYYYRYGSLHANIMGLEVVLPNGDIVNASYEPSHLKDNTGYALKHLFVGAEGTLGVVTNVALLCPRLPISKSAAFLACSTYQDVCETMVLAKSKLGEVLAAFEFMDESILKMVQGQGTPLPLSESHPYYILVETHGSNEQHDQEKMNDFVEAAFEHGVVCDGVLAQNLNQIEDFWKVRESCNPSVAASGFVYKYDVSLPIPDFEEFIEEVRSGLQAAEFDSTSSFPVCTNWGHVIDGNLHLNVVVPGLHERSDQFYERVEALVLDGIIRRGGSISAEHGLGQYKHKHMARIKDPTTLAAMRAIKSVFDPQGIMNPGKYLPEEL